MKILSIICFLLINTEVLIGQNLIPFRNDKGLSGYKNNKGIVVISPKYLDAFPFSEGLAHVHLNGKHGFIDQTGKEVIPIKYIDVDSFSEGLAGVNSSGKMIPDHPENVYVGGKWGFIDIFGKEVIPEKYDFVYSFNEGLAVVIQANKWGVIDRTGKEITALKYDEISKSFSDGLAVVRINDKWGIIDKSGIELMPLSQKYKHIGQFSESRALVTIGTSFVDPNGNLQGILYGYIDNKGNEVIPLKFSYATEFKNGKAQVEMDGRSFYIDKNGMEVK